jgi:arylsulfatase A-like enzyme
MFHEHVGLRPLISWEGVRNKRYKYARYIDQSNYEFLHDLARDPDEMENLADDSDYASILANLRKRTDDLVSGYGGPLKPFVAPKKK